MISVLPRTDTAKRFLPTAVNTDNATRIVPIKNAPKLYGFFLNPNLIKLPFPLQLKPWKSLAIVRVRNAIVHAIAGLTLCPIRYATTTTTEISAP